MGLDDIVRVNIPVPPCSPLIGDKGPWRVDFETYRTVAFNANRPSLTRGLVLE